MFLDVHLIREHSMLKCYFNDTAEMFGRLTSQVFLLLKLSLAKRILTFYLFVNVNSKSSRGQIIYWK